MVKSNSSTNTWIIYSAHVAFMNAIYFKKVLCLIPMGHVTHYDNDKTTHFCLIPRHHVAVPK